jgi:hypothetical protein
MSPYCERKRTKSERKRTQLREKRELLREKKNSTARKKELILLMRLTFEQKREKKKINIEISVIFVPYLSHLKQCVLFFSLLTCVLSRITRF